MTKESIRLHVTGKTQNGKSYYVKNTLLPELAKHKPVIIFDRKGEYAGSAAKDMPKNLTLHHSRSIWSFFGHLEKQKALKKQVYVITCRNDSDYNYGLPFFAALGQPVTLVLEEAQSLMKSKDFAQLRETVVNLARHGRHEGIGVVMISQRTLDVMTDIRSQLDAYISFHQAYNGDISELEKMGFTDANKLLDLNPREFLMFGVIPEHLKKIKKGAKNG